MKPTFIGIGAQKCASTWLYQVLDQHPGIMMSSVKEIDFFSYHYGRGFEWYEHFFARTQVSSAIGEISPSYFHHPQAPERAHAYERNLKIVVALRDPIERAISNHLHLVKRGFISSPDKSFEYGLCNTPMYVEQSRYGKHVANWMQCFPMKSIHFVMQEDLLTNAEAEARKLVRFLGVDAVELSLNLDRASNRSTVARSESLQRGLKAAADVGRRMGLRSVIDASKSLPPIKQLLEKNEVDLRTLIPSPRPETIEKLQDELRQDVEMIRCLLGRPQLPWRNFS
jgi:hypothetical protein